METETNYQQDLFKYYKDKEKCYNEIRYVRAVMGDKSKFNAKTYEGMMKGLSLMYLYCPTDISGMVLYTMKELEMRANLMGIVLEQDEPTFEVIERP